ncbi:MAG: hypothetical protein K9W44_01510 [Candidatus Lokiarchaeota archaeon]|nr:hypothetical protein [Candidatus Harpocratesius repetitus]
MKFIYKKSIEKKKDLPFDVIIKEYWLLIKDGKIQGKGLEPIGASFRSSAPIIELKFTEISSHPIVWNITHASKSEIVDYLLSYYLELTKTEKIYPGRYGDYIKCTEFQISGEKFIYLNFIGHLAWNKPTLAADLGIFIKARAQHYFVGIVRKNPPGKDSPAIIGGIRNTSSVLDSGIYTMLKEVQEESHLKIEYEGNLEELRENYSVDQIPVIVNGFENISPDLRSISAKIYYITTIPTTEQERNPDGTKRVYMTDAYALYLNLGDHKVEEKDLKKIFRPGDDAQEISIFNVTKAIIGGIIQDDLIPPFGLSHHCELFKNMVEFYRKQILN